MDLDELTKGLATIAGMSGASLAITELVKRATGLSGRGVILCSALVSIGLAFAVWQAGMFPAGTSVLLVFLSGVYAAQASTGHYESVKGRRNE
jgi:hypothetical protein